MRLPGRFVVPLNSMCSSTCDRPAPSHLSSWMLPLMAHAWADTTGALWSSRTMTVRPLSRLVSLTPGGSAGISGWSLAAGTAVAVIGAEIAGKRDWGAWRAGSCLQALFDLMTGASRFDLLAGKNGLRNASA